MMIKGYIKLVRAGLPQRGARCFVGCISIIVPFLVLSAISNYHFQLVAMILFVIAFSTGLTLCTDADCVTLVAASAGYAAALAIILSNSRSL